MTQALAQRLAKIQLEMQAVQSQLKTNVPATDDLSLVAVAPKWEGTVKTIPSRNSFVHSRTRYK
jgi:hypothetical protein